MAKENSYQHELLQLHSMPSWKRYESEEEAVSETSSHCGFSPVESDMVNESDVDEPGTEDEYLRTDALFSEYSHESLAGDSTSPDNNRLSILTAKLSNAATATPTGPGYARSTSVTDEYSPTTEYMTPPLSPILLSALNDGSDNLETSSLWDEDLTDTGTIDSDEGAYDSFGQILEAKAIVFKKPACKPRVVIIRSPLTTEAILSARMGEPVQGKDKKNPEIHPRNLKDRNLPQRISTKRSSSASDVYILPDRSKRYSAMFYRDSSRGGRPTYYVDSEQHPRSRSSHSPARSSSRGGVPYARKNSSSATQKVALDVLEARDVQPRRMSSQRRDSSSLTEGHDQPRNYSRPRTFRSASVASDTAAESSWRYQRNNRSSTSLHSSSASSAGELSSLSSSVSSISSSTSHVADKGPSKPAPHPLSIITMPTSPVFASPAPEIHSGSGAVKDEPQSGASAEEDLEEDSQSEIHWSPIEYQHSTYPKALPYSRPHNPSLSLSLTTDVEDHEKSPASISRRFRSGSLATPPTSSSVTPKTTVRKLSVSTALTIPAPSGANKSTFGNQSHPTATSTMKLLMGGIRGLGKQRNRH